MNRLKVLATVALLTAGLGTASAAVAADPPPAKAEAAAPAWGKLLSSDRKLAYPLDKPEVVVGTDPASGVVLHDNSVSPQHAKLVYKDGAVTIEDLGSKGGTLVAGTSLKKGKPFRIVQPVEIDVGAVTLYFEWGERPALLPPSQKATPGKQKAAPAKSKSPVGVKKKASPK
ncbi:MAG: FHA domain-containing protein [Deltaproteobacteria bacterium]|nr:FHA domain-containing protein [Deltaproteobacteria bacterium]